MVCAGHGGSFCFGPLSFSWVQSTLIHHGGYDTKKCTQTPIAKIMAAKNRVIILMENYFWCVTIALIPFACQNCEFINSFTGLLTRGKENQETETPFFFQMNINGKC